MASMPDAELRSYSLFKRILRFCQPDLLFICSLDAKEFINLHRPNNSVSEGLKKNLTREEIPKSFRNQILESCPRLFSSFSFYCTTDYQFTDYLFSSRVEEELSDVTKITKYSFNCKII